VEKDIIPVFEAVQLSAVPGSPVMVSVRIDSTFDKVLKNVSYKWEITSDGKPVENVTYLGKGMEAIGTVNLAADKTFSGMKKEETDPEEEIEERKKN